MGGNWLTNLRINKLAVIWGVLLFACSGNVGATQESLDADMAITLLGTGTPPISATQYGAATLVRAGGIVLLFDCGRGCGIRLMQAHPELYTKVNHLFFTHMHSDHLVDVPDIYMNGWLLGRSAPFFTYGPSGTGHFMRGLKQAFGPDIHTRSELENFPENTDGLKLEIAENGPDGGVVFDENGVQVIAFRVDHAEAKPAYGYRIEYRGRSIVLSGDTKPTPALIQYGKGADVIIHEVIPSALIEKLNAMHPPKQVQKIVDHHTKAADVGKLLAITQPRLAVYSHYLSTPESNVSLLAETQEYWGGPVVAGKDLMPIFVGAEIQVCSGKTNCSIIEDTK